MLAAFLQHIDLNGKEQQLFSLISFQTQFALAFWPFALHLKKWTKKMNAVACNHFWQKGISNTLDLLMHGSHVKQGRLKKKKKRELYLS